MSREGGPQLSAPTPTPPQPPVRIIVDLPLPRQVIENDSAPPTNNRTQEPRHG
jgi:hypothetical protein